jgi:GNAT superfamily N-acetyltransferase
MSVAVRPALPEDCSALFALIAEHARFEQSAATLTPCELLSILASDPPPVTILVAASGAELKGFAAITFDFALWRARRWAHLDCLFVREDARGLGLGTMLLGAAAEHALHCGADRMEWQTPAWNEQAIGFYRQTGALYASKLRFTLSPIRMVRTNAQ